jgi:hypothetical protein
MMTTYLVAPNSKFVHLTKDGRQSLCGQTIERGLAYKPAGWQACPACGGPKKYAEVEAEMAARLRQAKCDHKRLAMKMLTFNRMRAGLRAAKLIPG